MAALIGDDMPAEQENHVELQARDGLRELPIEKITSNRLNPRKTFNEAELEELAKSVKDKGILQQLIYQHLEKTDSARAKDILGDWQKFAAKFWKVHPRNAPPKAAAAVPQGVPAKA